MTIHSRRLVHLAWAALVALVPLVGCNNDPGPPPKGAPSAKEVEDIDIDVSPPTSSPKESSGDPATVLESDKGPSPTGQGEK